MPRGAYSRGGREGAGVAGCWERDRRIRGRTALGKRDPPPRRHLRTRGRAGLPRLGSVRRCRAGAQAPGLMVMDAGVSSAARVLKEALDSQRGVWEPGQVEESFELPHGTKAQAASALLSLLRDRHGEVAAENERSVVEWTQNMKPKDRLSTPLPLFLAVTGLLARPPAHVVNLSRRPYRWKAVSDIARREGLWLYRHNAVDWRALQASSGGAGKGFICEKEVATSWASELNTNHDRDCAKETTFDMHPSERACAASHLNLWKRHRDRKLAPFMPEVHPDAVLILEDDANLQPGFLEGAKAIMLQAAAMDVCTPLKHGGLKKKVGLGKEWDILYLGHILPTPIMEGVSFASINMKKAAAAAAKKATEQTPSGAANGAAEEEGGVGAASNPSPPTTMAAAAATAAAAAEGIGEEAEGTASLLPAEGLSPSPPGPATAAAAAVATAAGAGGTAATVAGDTAADPATAAATVAAGDGAAAAALGLTLAPVTFAWGLHAYLLTRAAAARLVDNLPVSAPADIFVASFLSATDSGRPMLTGRAVLPALATTPTAPGVVQAEVAAAAAAAAAVAAAAGDGESGGAIGDVGDVVSVGTRRAGVAHGVWSAQGLGP
ncbi:unnamed protein product, partial [Pylaiella littoralis]